MAKDQLIALLMHIIRLLLEERVVEDSPPLPPIIKRLLPLLCNDRIPSERRDVIIQRIFEEVFPIDDDNPQNES